ncbi:MAG: hypothetical protein QOG67_13 [Verrucomicrobiota bacterium]|jgi:hypothetical protein
MIRVALAVLCSIAVVNPLEATDKCQELSDIVGGAAFAKPAMVTALKKNPAKGPLGEAWRMLHYLDSSQLDTLGVPSQRQEYIYKTIVALNVSKNPEVNYDIFREYFYLECKRKERGLSSVPLSAIPAPSLTGLLEFGSKSIPVPSLC